MYACMQVALQKKNQRKKGKHRLTDRTRLMSHHNTYYVTSSYILCHIIIHTKEATLTFVDLVDSYVNMYTCMHVYMYACMHVYMCICMHVFVYISQGSWQRSWRSRSWQKAKETYYKANETWYKAKETYYKAKGTWYKAKETYYKVNETIDAHVRGSCIYVYIHVHVRMCTCIYNRAVNRHTYYVTSSYILCHIIMYI